MVALIRPGRDADGPKLIALIGACWSAYPGIRMDVDREMPELHALATYYAGQGGALWVADEGDTVAGMISVRPLAEAAWEICRVYVDPALHGSGLGPVLLERAERHAMASGAVRLVLWSDTRFERAHRFYEKWSYVRHGGVRILHDISNSLEFGYAKPVDAIEALDVAAATSAVGGLAGILIACVAEGASVSYLPSLMPDTANAFWQRAAMEVGTGKRVIVAAWRHGALVGTGMLNLATAETQSHLGVVQTILVDPGSRRAGLGRRILRALEAAAVLQGRSLLTLDSRAGDASEGLCRAEGWREAGRIPGFVKDADGTAHPTIFFWKEIGV